MNYASDKVRLTIALPVFNGGEYLQLAVQSVADQTFKDWELLILDDGSTDGALDSIAGFDDERIRIFRDGVNRGLAVRLNEALDMARGTFFARMDSDDVCYPDRFAHQMMTLEDDLELDLLATRSITIDESNRVIGQFPFARTHHEICAQPWRGFLLPHPTWMGRTEWFRRHRYGVPAAYLCEDQELLLRSYWDSKFATLDEILFAYRLRGNTDWCRLAKTRKAVLTFQRQQFVRTRQWHFLLLATLSYLAKSGRDVSKRLVGGALFPVVTVVDEVMVREWNQVLSGFNKTKTGNAK